MIQDRVVGVYLGKTADPEIVFGGTDPTRFGSIDYYHAANYRGMWQIPTVRIGYGKIVQNVNSGHGLLLLHTPFLLIPYSIIISRE